MKKVFMKLSGPAVLALAIALNSCNNAEETKKKVDEQNNQIQTQVDAKLNGLQDQVNMECTAMVDSMATARYNEWMATEGSKKGGKAAPKTKTKKEATKKDVFVPGKKGETAPTGFVPGKKGETAPTGFVPGKKK
jgi:hypothetical protein